MKFAVSQCREMTKTIIIIWEQQSRFVSGTMFWLVFLLFILNYIRGSDVNEMGTQELLSWARLQYQNATIKQARSNNNILVWIPVSTDCRDPYASNTVSEQKAVSRRPTWYLKHKLIELLNHQKSLDRTGVVDRIK